MGGTNVSGSAFGSSEGDVGYPDGRGGRTGPLDVEASE